MRPFAALRPPPDKARLAAAVSPEGLTTEEIRLLAVGNPLSFLRVLCPEIDLPLGAIPGSDEPYAKAAESFERLKRDLPLVRDGEPAIYSYRIESTGRSRVGLAGLFSLDDCESGRIARHEAVRREAVLDRARLLLAVGAHGSLATLFFRDAPELERAILEGCRGEPLATLETAEGVHSLARVEDADRVVDLVAAARNLYLADGHELVAAASRVRSEKRATGDSSDRWDHFPGVLFPARDLEVLACHRLVKDLGMRTEYFVEAVREVFGGGETRGGAPAGRGLCAMYVAGRWYELDLLRAVGGVMVISSPEESRSPVLVTEQPLLDTLGRLDEYLLQERLFRPFLGISDPRCGGRIEFLDGRPPCDLTRRVDARQAAAGFLLSPMGLEDVMAVAGSGALLPPRSTTFTPRPRAGLLVHQL
jgi:uncharacterized protein (DUF1015 family)